MTATGPARSPTSSPPPTGARRSSARSRRPRASRTPMRSRRSTASTASGSAISTSPSRSAFPASSTTRISSGRSTRTVAAAKKHKKALGRLVPDVADRASTFYAHGFDFICYSGDVWVLHNALAEAIGKLRDGCERETERTARWPTNSASRSPAISRRPTARRPIPISISRRSPRRPASRWRSSNRPTRSAPSSSRISTR